MRYRVYCGTEGMTEDTVRGVHGQAMGCSMEDCIMHENYADAMPVILYNESLLNHDIFQDNIEGLIDQVNSLGLEVVYENTDTYYDGMVYYLHRGTYHGQDCIMAVYVYSPQIEEVIQRHDI